MNDPADPLRQEDVQAQAQQQAAILMQALPHMLRYDVWPRRLMVQFHLLNDTGVEMAQIYARLEALGYRVLWTYGVVLTAWER